jgi:hypothetical protein
LGFEAESSAYVKDVDFHARSYFLSSSKNKHFVLFLMYESVSKSFQTGRLERELQMVQLSAARCSCIAIL